MKEESRNLVLAVVLSAIVLFGWQFLAERYFLPPPPPPPAAEAPAPAVAPSAATDGPLVPEAAIPAPAAPAVGLAPKTVAQALAASPRVPIRTPRLSGSINLVGARIDDLVLTDHRTGLVPNAPPVRLFAPSPGPGAYFAGFGWAGPGAPPADARWTPSGDVLAPGRPLTLSWTSPAGVTFEIRLEVDENFLFTATQRVVNGSGGAVAVRPYGFVNRTGTGPERDAFNLHVGPIAVIDGRLLESDISYDRLRERGPQTFRTTGGWLGITDKYWLAALIPDQKQPLDVRFTHAAEGDRFQTDFVAPAELVAPGAAAESRAHLFAGAKEVDLLNRVRDELGAPLFDRALAWGWFWFIAQPIFRLLSFFHGLFGNWGLAIIGLTLVVRLLLYPIANRQYASMAKLKVFAPKMKEIQERYKDDKVRQQQELMELYRREKINPLAGCLPILLQIPIFYALYKTLLIAIEIRHQPLGLWIRDLSAPDPLTPLNLFGLLPFQPPAVIAVGILPILLGVTMWLQFRLNPTPMDEVQKLVFSWMPWIFMFLMAPFAAGLQLYWIVNNIVSIAQQWWLNRKYASPAPAPSGGK
ncbi:membrane protein insertase YidC [Thermaurantiacus tibetensis]|uniref:membrane protein insertase YidC n=1 Tax=Thermaurantiacus tibetensis TaxID=2759035 RepID=UPI00188E204F|nr:membrane protein insertase YidC [Thermaurantiacus tibetensis]